MSAIYMQATSALTERSQFRPENRRRHELLSHHYRCWHTRRHHTAER